jgi:hypothetical protein
VVSLRRKIPDFAKINFRGGGYFHLAGPFTPSAVDHEYAAPMGVTWATRSGKAVWNGRLLATARSQLSNSLTEPGDPPNRRAGDLPTPE